MAGGGAARGWRLAPRRPDTGRRPGRLARRPARSTGRSAVRHRRPDRPAPGLCRGAWHNRRISRFSARPRRSAGLLPGLRDAGGSRPVAAILSAARACRHDTRRPRRRPRPGQRGGAEPRGRSRHRRTPRRCSAFLDPGCQPVGQSRPGRLARRPAACPGGGKSPPVAVRGRAFRAIVMWQYSYGRDLSRRGVAPSRPEACRQQAAAGGPDGAGRRARCRHGAARRAARYRHGRRGSGRLRHGCRRRGSLRLHARRALRVERAGRAPSLRARRPLGAALGGLGARPDRPTA